jgi:CubicO group peptidase (beta-lactamase class C family)
MRLGDELSKPRLVSRRTLDRATSVSFPGLSGVLPGFGRQDPNDWGLGVEIRGAKRPHWTGGRNSPATYGHFGRSGAFIWVDPQAGVWLAALGEEPFGSWAVEAWPSLSDAVLAEVAGRVRTPDRTPPP